MNDNDMCPVTGNPCLQKKVVRVTEIVDGGATTTHMCDECPRKVQEAQEKAASLLFALFVKAFATSSEKCPGCGTNADTIRTTGKMGCPKCYNYFSLSMPKIMEKCQSGQLQHCGKRPSQSEALISLSEKMKEAIRVENYEIAGILKAKIDELTAPVKLPDA